MDVINEIRKYINNKNARYLSFGSFLVTKTRNEPYWDFSLNKELSNDPNSNKNDVFIRVEICCDDSIFLHHAEFHYQVFSVPLFFLLDKSGNETNIIFDKCRFHNKLEIRNKGVDQEGIPYAHDDPKNDKTSLKELKFTDCVINTVVNPPYIRVGFLDIKKFALENLKVPVNAQVDIGNCYFDNFTLSNFCNLGKFRLYNINIQKKGKKKGTFQLNSTSIGDTDFQSINLVSFKKRIIYDNILSGIDYTNVRWESDETHIRVVPCGINDGTALAKKRDTYRVLKNVAQKNDDSPQAFSFYAKEMKYHREIIKNSTSLCKLIKMPFNEILSKLLERTILWFNRCTNNFGQNWLLAVFLIFISGGVFYTFLLLSLCLSPLDLSNWNKFFMFLNPIDEIDFVDKCEWSNWSYFWGFSFRIVEGLLIYQAIQAFRRYSRKF